MGESVEITDALVAAAADGQEPQRQTLLEALAPRVRVMINARLNPTPAQVHAAEDLVQDVLMQLGEGLTALRARTAGGVRAFASTIASRRVADLLRGRGQPVGAVGQDGVRSLHSSVIAGMSAASPLWAMLSAGGASPASLADQADLARRVMNELAMLKPEHREAITLAFFDQLETRDIAERMGLSRPAASMLLIRALKALRRRLTGSSQVIDPDDERTRMVMNAERNPVSEAAADEVDRALRLFWSGSGAELDALLRDGDPTTPGLLDQAIGAARGQLADGTGEPFPTIEGFEILAEIGRGGMGVVYRARQLRPRREVALKVLSTRRGGDAYHRALFDREIQALGMLAHPNIAALHQAGTTDDGRAAFAMELAEGRSLVEHATDHGLGTPARLALFLQVCDAVHHAHLRGVIHRDLKPSNIVITARGDGEAGAIVKVLDFGLARLTGGNEGVSIDLEPGRIKGTLAYMSPEQARGGAHDVDARSDVYSLGVILYEMLGGRHPLDLSSRSVSEALRAVEQDAPTPLGRINPSFRGDFEAITTKAMEKDAPRRYGSVAQLAEDIRRHLDHLPVLARPAGGMYVLRTLARRHRAAVWGAAAVAAALVIGLAATWIAWMEARQARREAEHSQETAQQVNDFLNRMLGDPGAGAAGGGDGRGAQFSVRQMMEQAVGELDRDALHGQPEAEIQVRMTVGRTFTTLGFYDQASAQYDRALVLARALEEPDGLKTAEAALRVADMHMQREEWDQANALADEALVIRAQAAPGDRALQRDAQYRKCRALSLSGRHDEARLAIDALLQEALRENAGSPDTLEIADYKAALGFLGGSDVLEVDVLQNLRDALAVYRREYGDRHDRVAYALVNLGSALRGHKEVEDAEAALNEALAIRTALYGEDHPGVASVLYNMAGVRRSQNRYDEEMALYERALDIRKRFLPPDHYLTERTHLRVGQCLMRAKRLAEAEEHFRASLAIWQAHPEHRDVPGAQIMDNLGRVLLEQARYAEAEPVMLETWEMVMRHAPDHPTWPRNVIRNLVRLYERWGRAAESQMWSERLKAAGSAPPGTQAQPSGEPAQEAVDPEEPVEPTIVP